ncbi:hypothetical protein P153DRAFT_148796 [Dothidotthia symphoricarpi CBS 119687]|uniref:Uncharacterized protein n=1 Tax=Dothidotthia symphoricarpi CBS 119687 TaxID=1392245 RepID=A0A6A5ZVN0_9PLEO|nr:uncharacterized protein P153DRAFT_148796 [Dothidotthia symphoricarpi CBS 119687]KAF2123650.1 hypothetical protein P153DRAFT_148796 [Dothidotthia symphoricarpi CBS 119687]
MDANKSAVSISSVAKPALPPRPVSSKSTVSKPTQPPRPAFKQRRTKKEESLRLILLRHKASLAYEDWLHHVVTVFWLALIAARDEAKIMDEDNDTADAEQRALSSDERSEEEEMRDWVLFDL